MYAVELDLQAFVLVLNGDRLAVLTSDRKFSPCESGNGAFGG